MPINWNETLRRGGKGLLDFLQYAVLSTQPEPVFVALAGEYRLRPTAPGAVALFDLFCAETAPFRLQSHELIPPRNLALPAAIAPLRAALTRLQTAQPEEDVPPVPLPAGHLFASLVDRLIADPDGPLVRAAADFDPALGPVGSLPGGKLSPGKRAFVENVWCRRVRPVLVAAGFWRVATIGQP